jgi:hypothetical protein
LGEISLAGLGLVEEESKKWKGRADEGKNRRWGGTVAINKVSTVGFHASTRTPVLALV